MKQQIEELRRRIVEARIPTLEAEMRWMGAELFELYNSGLTSVQLQMLRSEFCEIIYSKHLGDKPDEQ